MLNAGCFWAGTGSSFTPINYFAVFFPIIEFLKEALAVSQLKHENIVEFLGVCLDSNLIILELMEGGELLTYLKSMRR